MPETVLLDDLEQANDAGQPPPGDPGHPGDGPRDPRASPRVPASAYYTGMSLALAGILMFFMALVSSYIVRKGDTGWQPVQLPAILWVTTAVLIASSITLSRALRALRLNDALNFSRWWGVTTVLGAAFLAGQILAWRQLADSGVFLSSHPASSFFYLLTASHGVHLFGGVIALLYVGRRDWSRSVAPRAAQATAAGVTGVYWHFMDGLWVFLFLVLSLGK